MPHFDYSDIQELAKSEPNKKLRIHWEGAETEAEGTTPYLILSDIEAGDFTADEFDAIGYCVTEEDYQAEQSQA